MINQVDCMSNKEKNYLDFSWRELDCFLRPQTVLCNRISPGQDMLLMFLTVTVHSF
jgi:hypothetical protein